MKIVLFLITLIRRLEDKKVRINRRQYLKGFTGGVSTKCKIRPFKFLPNHSFEITLGEGSVIHDNVIIQGSSKLKIGARSFVGEYSVIGVNESIYIGEDVMIAQAVSIRDTDHAFHDLNKPMLKQGIVTKPIVIKDNVWIGYGAVITKGVTIESGSIIGANAVVTKDVPANSIVGGVPARVIKLRAND